MRRSERGTQPLAKLVSSAALVVVLSTCFELSGLRLALAAPQEVDTERRRRADGADGPPIRIGLLTDVTSVSLGSAMALLVRSPDSESVVSGQIRVEAHVRSEADAGDAAAQEERRIGPSPGYELIAFEADRAIAASTSLVVSPKEVGPVTAAAQGREPEAPATSPNDNEESSRQRPTARAFPTVRVAGREYRGEIHVILNRRGRINVVNVLPVEQYLRGVVPLELSPGPHPQLEALKAQAIAARSYALASRGRFRSEGFDLRDDARSQVYGGLSAELPLTDRAVEETKGIVAAYLGDDGKYAPIEALYTANCGGHTENNEAVFLTKPVPYLRAVECRVDNASSVGREIASTTLSEALVSAEGRRLAREVALLRVLGFWLPRKVTSRYLSVAAEEDELLDWLEHTSRLFRRSLPDLWRVDARRVDVFSQLIAALVYGPGRATFMLTPADTNYLLSGLGLSHVPREARTSIALLVRDGILRLPGDGRLNGQDTVTHELAIEALARAAIARSKLGGLDNDSSKDIAGAVALRSRPKSTPAAAPPARRQPKANRLASKKTTQSNTPAKKGTQQLSSGTSGARTNKTLKAAKAAGSKPTAGKNVKKPSTGNRKDAGRAIGQAGNRPRRLSSSSPALRLDLYTALAAPAQEGRLIVAQRGESPKPRARTQSSTTNVGLQLTKPASEAQSRKFDVDAAALLFRRLGGESYAVSRLTLIGGERVIYHVNAAGRVDFIEAEPAEESAASDILGAYQWIERMNADEVRRKLAAVRIDVGEVEDLAPAELGESGRVTELEIVGNRGRARLRGYHIRSVLGLKENLFVIDRKQEPGRQLVFVFAGRGWGHGVGMCQTGAYGLAKAGYSYRAIIQKYYSGVRVRKIY